MTLRTMHCRSLSKNDVIVCKDAVFNDAQRNLRFRTGACIWQSRLLDTEYNLVEFFFQAESVWTLFYKFYCDRSHIQTKKNPKYAAKLHLTAQIQELLKTLEDAFWPFLYSTGPFENLGRNKMRLPRKSMVSCFEKRGRVFFRGFLFLYFNMVILVLWFQNFVKR